MNFTSKQEIRLETRSSRKIRNRDLSLRPNWSKNNQLEQAVTAILHGARNLAYTRAFRASSNISRKIYRLIYVITCTYNRRNWCTTLVKLNQSPIDIGLYFRKTCILCRDHHIILISRQGDCSQYTYDCDNNHQLYKSESKLVSHNCTTRSAGLRMPIIYPEEEMPLNRGISPSTGTYCSTQVAPASISQETVAPVPFLGSAVMSVARSTP